MSTAPPTHTDLKSTLEELRASVAAKGTRKGLTGAIQEAFLGILSVLLAMLEDFRAGRFVPMAPVAVEAGDGAAADRCAELVSPLDSGLRRNDEFQSGLGCEADRRANGVAGAKGAAAGETVGAAEVTPPALRTNPAKGLGTILRASPRFGMMARLRPRAGWRNARGIRRAFPPYGGMADGAEAKFFKNAAAGERISAGMLFQHQNDTIAAWSRRIFSYYSLSSLSQVRPQAERAVTLLALPEHERRR